MIAMPPPMPAMIVAPIHRLHRLVGIGGLADDLAIGRRGHRRRCAGKGDAQRCERGDQDCTHVPLLLVREARSRLPCSDVRDRAPTVRACRTPLRESLAAATRTARGQRIHCLFIPWRDINYSTWAKS